MFLRSVPDQPGISAVFFEQSEIIRAIGEVFAGYQGLLRGGGLLVGRGVDCS